ncbi:MAG: hypothetical protein NTV21_05105 [Planctomycetota bacterium]|nr:hypothetical protein [Planctomycetota bacterium]
MPKKIAVAVSFLVSAFICGWLTLGVLVVPLFVGPCGIHARPFDAEVWNAPDWRDSEDISTDFHSVRQRMVDDLLETKLVPGVTEAELLEWIGPADELREGSGAATAVWKYNLGSERGMGVDSEWLEVALDRSGRVLQAGLYRD